jgi:hypothetical protein
MDLCHSVFGVVDQRLEGARYAGDFDEVARW